MTDFTRDDEKLAEMKAELLASFKGPNIDERIQEARDQEASEMRLAALDIVRQLKAAFVGGDSHELRLAVGEICALVGEPKPDPCDSSSLERTEQMAQEWRRIARENGELAEFRRVDVEEIRRLTRLVCSVERDGVRCTQPENHDGPHIGTSSRTVITWLEVSP